MDALNALLSQTATATRLLSSASLDIQNILAKSALVTQESSAVAKQAAVDASAVVAAEQAAKLNTQNAMLKVGAAFGTNVMAQDEVLSALASQAKSAFDKQQQIRAKIDEKNSVSFFENPLGYLVNQMTLNDDINAHNSAVREKDAAFSQIERLNAATQTTTATQLKFEQSVTEASAAAATRNAAAKWTLEANRATIEGLNTNISGIQTAIGATKDQLEMMSRAVSAVNQQESLSIQQAHLAIARQASARADAEWEFRKKQLTADAKYESSIIDQINAGRAARGAPALSGVQTTNVLATLRAKGEFGDELRSDWRTGEGVMMTGEVKLAPNEVSVYQRLKSGQAMNLPPMQRDVASRIVAAGDAAYLAYKNSVVYDAKDKEAAALAISKGIRAALAQEASNVNSIDNLFQIASLKAIAEAAPTSANLSVWKDFLKPRADAGEEFSSAEKVIAALANGISTGKLTHKQALEISTMYQQGALINSEQRAFKKFGLDIAPQYTVRIGGLFGSFMMERPIDMTKSEEVGRALSKMLANARYSAGRPVSNPNFGFNTPASSATISPTSVDTSFGPEITNTPEKYNEGRRRLGQMINKGQ